MMGWRRSSRESVEQLVVVVDLTGPVLGSPQQERATWIRGVYYSDEHGAKGCVLL